VRKERRKKFCLSVKTNCLLVENVTDETPVDIYDGSTLLLKTIAVIGRHYIGLPPDEVY